MTFSQSQVTTSPQPDPRLAAMRANLSNVTGQRRETKDPASDSPKKEGGSRAFDQTFGSDSFTINNSGGESFDYAKDPLTGGDFFATEGEEKRSARDDSLDTIDRTFQTIERITNFVSSLYEDTVVPSNSYYSLYYGQSYAAQETYQGIKVMRGGNGAFDLSDAKTVEALSRWEVVGEGKDAYISTDTQCLAPNAMAVQNVLDAKEAIASRLDVSKPEVAEQINKIEFDEQAKCWDTGASCIAPNSVEGQKIALAKSDLENGQGPQYSPIPMASRKANPFDLPASSSGQVNDLFAVSKLLSTPSTSLALSSEAPAAPAPTEEIAAAEPASKVVPPKPVVAQAALTPAI